MMKRTIQMRSNTSLKEIGSIMNGASSVAIFPHINPDGDALGSAIALCLHLRSEGKESFVILEDEFPRYVDFLDTGCCSCSTDYIGTPDVCICVDCCEEKRFPGSVQLYNSGRTKISIDHHEVEEPSGDYYYVDSGESAAAQIIYRLFLEMSWEIDSNAARHLYTGIVTDTGCFQYSNTGPETHMTAAELMKYDIGQNDIMVRLFQNISLRRVQLQAKVIENMEIFASGMAAVSYVTDELLEEMSAKIEDAEGMVDVLRNIEGVEIAAFLKEKGDSVRVSMRAKSSGDVNSIAVSLGGGGHIKAAGCTLDMDMSEALAVVKREITASLEGQM